MGSDFIVDWVHTIVKAIDIISFDCTDNHG